MSTLEGHLKNKKRVKKKVKTAQRASITIGIQVHTFISKNKIQGEIKWHHSVI